jgi:hypothetical protein
VPGETNAFWDPESVGETRYWLSQPRIHESVAEADADIAAGRGYDQDEMRAELGTASRGLACVTNPRSIVSRTVPPDRYRRDYGRVPAPFL